MKPALLRKTDLAVRALRLLDDRGGRIGTAEMAAAIGSTAAYVPQVMAPLLREGWVTSSRGPTGGYELCTSVRSISMRQVIEAVEGPIDDGRCVLRPAPCPGTEPCAVHDAWGRARAALLDELDATPVTAATHP